MPDQDAITVREAFAAEAPHLLKLPDNPYPVVEQVVPFALPGRGPNAAIVEFLRDGAV